VANAGATAARVASLSQRRETALGGRPLCPERDLVRAANGHSLGRFAQGAGLRVRDDVLEATARLASLRRVGQAAPGTAGAPARV